MHVIFRDFQVRTYNFMEVGLLRYLLLIINVSCVIDSDFILLRLVFFIYKNVKRRLVKRTCRKR
ncbi:hypothetical protein C2G38_2082699 [Gigaspora rosea]|uniref:Uncharacterized protein n=1 Tax=Gigaspora rosea TaxID=44941 RepID=A0A397VE48_9GLOM|nr:hypothetical protein C2G38_2082699 [Gigaspora rosea]